MSHASADAEPAYINAAGTLSKTAMLQSLAKNFGTVTSLVPPFLNIVDLAHRLVGPKPMQFLSDQWMKLPGHIMPAWNPYMPRVRTLVPAVSAEGCLVSTVHPAQPCTRVAILHGSACLVSACMACTSPAASRTALQRAAAAPAHVSCPPPACRRVPARCSSHSHQP